MHLGAPCVLALAQGFSVRKSGVGSDQRMREAEAPFRPIPNSLRLLEISLTGTIAGWSPP
jgi:hypothetical protein